MKYLENNNFDGHEDFAKLALTVGVAVCKVPKTKHSLVWTTSGEVPTSRITKLRAAQGSSG